MQWAVVLFKMQYFVFLSKNKIYKSKSWQVEVLLLAEDERHKANVENTLAATRKAAEDAAFAAQMTAINTSW